MSRSEIIAEIKMLHPHVKGLTKHKIADLRIMLSELRSTHPAVAEILTSKVPAKVQSITQNKNVSFARENIESEYKPPMNGGCLTCSGSGMYGTRISPVINQNQPVVGRSEVITGEGYGIKPMYGTLNEFQGEGIGIKNVVKRVRKAKKVIEALQPLQSVQQSSGSGIIADKIKRTKKLSAWDHALTQYRKETGVTRIPKKGTPEHDLVMKMKELHIGRA